MRLRWNTAAPVIAIAALCLFAPSARAVLDIEDRGPVLRAGRFAMRVSNVGVIGNPWFGLGRSFDPSFEFPRGSGQELLGRAELWVSGRRFDGVHRVSGGPMYEWRPTIDPADRVRNVVAGAPGSRWNFDDDGDGRVDDETFNGRDDDGDGRVDEDFDLPAQQMLTAEFTDDRPEAVSYAYPNGEQHLPLGLAVHQEVLGWSQPGSDNIAVLRFVVTNTSGRPMTDVRLGIYVDLDSRLAAARGGHLDDRVIRMPYDFALPQATVRIVGGCYPPRGGGDMCPQYYYKPCVLRISGEVVAVADGSTASALPCGAVVPLSHTTDPLALLEGDHWAGVPEARTLAHAPGKDTTFRCHVFAQDLVPGQGGPPVLDEQRLAALEGSWPVARENETHDYAVLVTCGPFPRLAPGTSLEFSAALVAAASPDSVPNAALNARLLSRGSRYDLLTDHGSEYWNEGISGINGHETCYEPPAGITFHYDPHCPQKFFRDSLLIRGREEYAGPPGGETDVVYSPGHCVWTDFDCDVCTGWDGTDAVHRWSIASLLPPPPTVRATARDGEAVIEWDDTPEAAVAARLVGDSTYSFSGYKLYRLDDWRRSSLLPSPEQWQRIAVYRADTSAYGGLPLASITDETLAPDGDVNGIPKHPVGRYRVVDRGLHNGADYNYVVTSFVRAHAPADTLPSFVAERESPFVPDYGQRIVPRTEASSGPPRSWVTPNPYRGRAEWERTPVPGDPFTRHLDFMGLPRERCTIRIYTVAGDLVASLEHDGSNGNGQAAWNLITRNGQDVASGIYLFTVDGPSGHQVGRFVIMR